MIARVLAVLLGLLGLGSGCARDAGDARDPAEPVPARALVAEPAPSPDSPPADAPAPRPGADAALAGSATLPVLVPATLDPDAPDAPDELDAQEALAAAIDAEVSAAAAGKGQERVVIYARTTLDYGCKCPPFTLAPLLYSTSFVLPVYAAGVPEPQLTLEGVYRLAGHFDGRRITGFDWLAARGEEATPAMAETFSVRSPVFVVEGWCFEPVAEFEDAFSEEHYGPVLEAMELSGRFCPGSRFPAPAPAEAP